MNPKISIIVPVYKVEQYLPRCIDSILAQTFTDFELLLIDDGSPDRSGEICDEYALKDSRIRVFHKENGGVSSARNMGLDNAKGEWITFCDSDDYYVDKTLASYYNIITNNSDVDIIKSGFNMVHNSNKVITYRIESDFISENKEQILYMCERSHYCGFLWNTCLKSEIAKQLKLDENISWCEDQLYVYTCLLKGKKIFLSKEVLYNYVIINAAQGFGDNLSSRKRDYNEIIRIAFLEKEIKMKFYNQMKSLKDIINKGFYDKIELAVFYTFFQRDILLPFKISKKYMKGKWRRFLHAYLKYIKSIRIKLVILQ